MSLTAKQERFVAEYLIDLNATAAYKRAGYKADGHSAESAAARLLSNVEVAQQVQAAMDKRSNDLGIDAQYVLKTIRDTMERCAQAVPVRDRDGGETGEYKFDASAVLKGAELLGKHLKMFTDKTELSGPNGGPVDMNWNINFIKPRDAG
jgi:phage terminase small subunit